MSLPLPAVLRRRVWCPLPRSLVWCALLSVGLTLGCTTPRRDVPAAVRHSDVPLGPLYSSSSSEDGSSWDWSTFFWLVGADADGERNSQRVLPFWWHGIDPPYSETTFVLPLYYERASAAETVSWWTPLYGQSETPETRADYLLLNLWDWTRAKSGPSSHSGLFLIYDNAQLDERRHDFTLLPILGLAHLFHGEWGFPAAGENAPALGRSSSRRFDLLDLLGIVQLFGYDDVGDRREVRGLTLFSDEVLSLFRSWRGRSDDDPFVREWLFPLSFNVADTDYSWSAVGPLWGHIDDHVAETETNWWLLGLLSRSAAPEGNTWRLLGLPILSP